MFELLLPVPGLDRLTIDVVIAKTGADMDRFPSPAQLASWAGLCPGNHESAGKRRRSAPTGQPVAAACLVQAAHAAAAPRQLLRRPIPPDRPPARAQQGRRRGRPQPA
jgi:transposase